MRSIWDYENLLVFLTRGIILFSAFVVFTSFFYQKAWELSVSTDNFLGETVAGISQAPLIQNAFAIPEEKVLPPVGAPPVINAAAASLTEIKNEKSYVWLAQDAQKKLPVASLTKLMTALVVLENYDLNQKVTINEEVMKQEGVQGVLEVGQTLSVKDLLYIALIESSNRAAFALAQVSGEEKFVEKMNQRAGELGLLNTHFADSSGLSENSYSSAQDITTLTQYLIKHYPLFSDIVRQKTYDIYLSDGTLHHHLENTNKLLGVAPSVIGGKTGYTLIAKGCVMIIEQNEKNQDYSISVVLGADDRFQEVQKIINWNTSN